MSETTNVVKSAAVPDIIHHRERIGGHSKNEAAGMATHYVSRELIALGHEAKLVPPAYAKAFRRGHKNDFRDAHAVASVRLDVSAQARVVGEWVPRETHTMTARRVSGAQLLAHFCAAGWEPPGTEAGMTSHV